MSTKHRRSQRDYPPDSDSVLEDEGVENLPPPSGPSHATHKRAREPLGTTGALLSASDRETPSTLQQSQLNVDVNKRPRVQVALHGSAALFKTPANVQHRAQMEREAAHEEATQHESDFRNRLMAGQVKRVHVKDFMCHKNLQIDFGPHITIITGANGSGKSAVLQALQVCLGVSARSTGRGVSLSGFVRNGEEGEVVTSALVQVTLCNETVGCRTAYKPHIYGKEMTIERRIRRTPGGTYRLLNEWGVSVSTKREDLDSMLDHFSINAANPLSIITQDIAKSFHGKGDANDERYKFKMYMQGTQLEGVQQNLSEANYKIRDYRSDLKRMFDQQRVIEVELEKLREAQEKLKDIEQLKDTVVALQCVNVWQDVRETEQQIAAVKDAIVMYKNTVTDNESKRDALVAEKETLDAELAVKSDAMNNTLQQTIRIKERVKETMQQAKQARSRRSRIEQNIKEMTNQCEDWRSQRAELQTQMEQVSASQRDNEALAEAKRLLDDFGKKTQERRDAVQQLEEEFAAERRNMNQCTEHIAALQNQQKEIKWQLQQMQGAQADLQQFATNASNRAAMFAGRDGGRNMLALLEEIRRNAQRFKRPPVGPIGMYLGLNDTRHGMAAEAHLRGLFHRFLCFSSQDLYLLRELGNRVGYKVEAFIVQPNIPKHNVQRIAPQGLQLLMDVLTINHEEPWAATALFNALVDKGGIDSCVLCRDQNQARDLVYDHSNRGYTFMAPDGWAFRLKGRGTIDQSPFQMHANARPRLGADISEIRRGKEQHLEYLGQQQELRLQDLADLEQRLHEASQEKNRLAHVCAGFQNRKRAAQKQLNDLEYKTQELLRDQQAQGSADEDEQRIYEYTQMIMEYDANDAQNQIKLREAQEQLQAAQEEAQRLKQLVDQAQAEAADLRDLNLIDLKEEVDALAARSKGMQNKLKAFEKTIQGFKQDLWMREETLRTLQPTLTEYQQQAQSICTEEQYNAMLDDVKAYFNTKFQDRRAEGRRSGGGGGRGKRGSGRQGTQHADIDDEDLQAEIDERIEAALKPQALAEEIGHLEKRCEVEERDAGGDINAIEDEIEKQEGALAKKQINVNGSNKIFSMLKESSQKRVDKLTNMSNEISDMCNRTFHRLMKRRNHVGELKIDYHEEMLKANVKMKVADNPELEKKTDWVGSLQSLSGGERSYTTVCMLLAIAERCEFPFHCLDEYDVFMDEGNRKIATIALLAFAAERRERQLILLSPQDMALVPECVKQVEREIKMPLPKHFVAMRTMHAPRD